MNALDDTLDDAAEHVVAALGRLRGEWAEVDGGQMEVVSVPSSSADSLADIDLLVFPSKILGKLCETDLLRPVRKGVLKGDEFNASDVFPVVRDRLVHYGQQPMALPLSVQIPELSVSLDGAMLLLVRAAPAAWDRHRDGVLFDTNSMRPRIAEPAFVRALEEIAMQRDDVKQLDQEPSLVTVLGLGGSMVGVTSSTHNAASAFRLLAWIASAEISGQLLSDNGQFPVRMSHLAKPSQFFGKAIGTVEENRSTRDVALAAKAALSRSDCLVFPRIPGIDEYLNALQSAVDAAVSGESNPEVALATAAKMWEGITDQRGRDKQKQIYLRHLNLE